MNFKRLWLAAPLLVAALVLSTALSGWTAEIKRTPFTKQEAAQPENSAQAAKIVTVDNLVFPSGIYGTKPNALDQVDEVIEKMNARLAEQGLTFGNMLQHTWFVKDGVDPIAVLTRFGEAVNRVAPSLKKLRSVGTIIRLPEMPGNSMVMLDIVAGKPLARGEDTDGYKRVPFVYGSQGIVESISGNKIMFTSGMEALDFQNMKLVPNLEDQIAVIVGKLESAFKNHGLSLAQMVQHNIYYKVGADPSVIVQKFHEEMNKREPLHKKYPGVGAMMAVDGMAMPGFWLEIDAVGTTIKPEEIKGVPYAEVAMDVNEVATVGDLSYIVDVVGNEYSGDMKYPEGMDAQIELAVKNLRDFMKPAGLDLSDLVKVRLMVKKGAGAADKVRAKFYQEVARYAPGFKAQPAAETLIFVEKLDRGLVFQVVPIAAKARPISR
jgi:enamine deaminase RidA (YjgF/YER057c/UK114 family)